MNKAARYSLCFLILLPATVACWNGKENTTGSINFYGKLTTQEGNSYTVDHILLGNKYSQIDMFEKPSEDKHTVVPITQNGSHVEGKEILLTSNPSTNLAVTQIDLNETSAIQVPEPHTTWTYQENKGGRKKKYIELIVISNGDSPTKSHYLITRRTKLKANNINKAGPKEMSAELPAIKELKIDGYYATEPKEEAAPVKPTKSKKSSPKKAPATPTA